MERNASKTNREWTQIENDIFENALAHVDSTSPDRWERLAYFLPGRTVDEVKSHYSELEEDVNDIEAGLIPCPDYTSLMIDCPSDIDEQEQTFCVLGKRGRDFNQARKKGVPWTEEEHRQFLLGLSKHGKGDWKSISRNFVISKNPTQVASHAQKYYNRLNSNGNDKKRASIHDIPIDFSKEYSASSASVMDTASNHVEEETKVYGNGLMQLN